MSPAPDRKDVVAALENPPRDQRLHKRYPIKLDVQYRLLNGHRLTEVGSGRTSNMSSAGIFFETKHVLPIRKPIELAIDWPFLLEGSCRLKLIVQGSILRSDAWGTAVEIKQHEFRTSKRSPK